jgi:hypothetical protein
MFFMKTNQFIFAALTAAFLSVANYVAAQVTIGGSELPKAGTILDLNSTTKGGLVLSNVKLTALDLIPTTFPNASAITTTAHKQALAGMIVWNTNDFLTPNGDGLYLWDGSKWVYTGGSDGQAFILPAVIITPATSGGYYCGAITFKISKPTGNEWDTFWDDFSIANITEASLGGVSRTVSDTDFDFDGTDYYYTISATADNQSDTYITVGGSVNGASVISQTSSTVTVTNQNVPSHTLAINGIQCFFVSYSETLLGSEHPFDYKISGDVTNGSISDVVWSYTTTQSSIVADFAPSGNGATSKATVTYDERVNIAAGNTVTIIATVTVTGDAGCAIVYVLTKTVKFQGTGCSCPGVIIAGGVHEPLNFKTVQVPDNKTYADITNSANSWGIFKKVSPAKDLCVYYRDGVTTTSQSTASTGCGSSGTSIDSEHKYMTWRLPNLAELGQMSTNADVTTPKYNELKTAPDAYFATRNMNTNFGYISNNLYDSGTKLVWSFSNDGYVYQSDNVFLGPAPSRCVRTME